MSGLNATYIQGYADTITGIINSILVPVLISIAFIVFLWGIYLYFIKGADNEEKRTEGRTFSLYGIIGFVILFSVWGIVQIFMGTLNLSAKNAPLFPTIGTGSTNNNTSVSPIPSLGGPYYVQQNQVTSPNSNTSLPGVLDQVVTQAYNAYSDCEMRNGFNNPSCSSLWDAYQQTLRATNTGGGSNPAPTQTECTPYSAGECPNGEVCDAYGSCPAPTQTECTPYSAGECPNGEVCDAYGSCPAY